MKEVTIKYIVRDNSVVPCVLVDMTQAQVPNLHHSGWTTALAGTYLVPLYGNPVIDSNRLCLGATVYEYEITGELGSFGGYPDGTPIDAKKTTVYDTLEEAEEELVRPCPTCGHTKIGEQK